MLVLAPVWLIAVTTTIAIAIGLVVGFCIGYIGSEDGSRETSPAAKVGSDSDRERYTEEQFNRLPKWAQTQIENDQRTIASLKAHIAELNQSQPDSNVQVSSHIYGDYGLPHDSGVDFYLGDGPYRKFRDMISVQILRTRDRKAIRVSTSGQIVVKPTGGCNVIEVTTDE